MIFEVLFGVFFFGGVDLSVVVVIMVGFLKILICICVIGFKDFKFNELVFV